jgi:hypothetical protein
MDDSFDSAQIDAFAGQRKRNEAMAGHEEHKGEAITWLRKEMAKLYCERARVTADAFVSAEDARRIYMSSKFPREYSKTLAFMGAIFRGKDWQFTGSRIQSKHPANNAREVKCWRYVGPGAPPPSATRLRPTQMEVYELFRGHGAMTHSEAWAAYTESPMTYQQTPASVRSRTAELVQLGLLESKGSLGEWGIK